jgi:hypothetical protein
MLGYVYLGKTLNAGRFKALLVAHVKEAIELGYKFGQAEVAAENTAMVKFLRDTYGLEPDPWGREPNSGVVKSWRYTVELGEFLKKLEGAGVQHHL